MEPPLIGLIGIGVLFLLMFLGLPVGFAFLLVGFTGVGFLTTMGMGLSILGVSPYATAASYFFAVLPCFMLMGLLCGAAGLVTEVYRFFHTWFGHLRGGLAIATTGACAAYAGVTGETFSACAIMGKLSLPEMRKYKYDSKLATGTIAAGGTLGILIPPSGALILYGIITGTSIGKLFISGILPGILLAFLFMLVIYIQARLNPSLALPGPKFSWRERFSTLRGTLPILVLFILVIGGMYLGIFTPTEAGAVGAFLAFVIALIKRKLSKEGFITCLKDTMLTTGMIFVILIGAMVFNYFIVMSGLSTELANFIAVFAVSPYLVFTFAVVILLILGALMDEPPMILLTMPILFPIVTQVGFDPVWFGVTSTLLCTAGLILPPVGMNVFIVAGVADVPLFDVYRGILPFFLAILACIALLTIFPQIALFLPNLMK